MVYFIYFLLVVLAVFSILMIPVVVLLVLTNAKSLDKSRDWYRRVFIGPAPTNEKVIAKTASRLRISRINLEAHPEDTITKELSRIVDQAEDVLHKRNRFSESEIEKRWNELTNQLLEVVNGTIAKGKVS